MLWVTHKCKNWCWWWNNQIMIAIMIESRLISNILQEYFIIFPMFFQLQSSGHCLLCIIISFAKPVFSFDLLLNWPVVWFQWKLRAVCVCHDYENMHGRRWRLWETVNPHHNKHTTTQNAEESGKKFDNLLTFAFVFALRYK